MSVITSHVCTREGTRRLGMDRGVCKMQSVDTLHIHRIAIEYCKESYGMKILSIAIFLYIIILV